MWHDRLLVGVAELCEEIGLTMSRKCAKQIKVSTVPELKISVNNLRSLLQQLDRGIVWEMEESSFLH